jgi:hypothetical protein
VITIQNNNIKVKIFICRGRKVDKDNEQVIIKSGIEWGKKITAILQDHISVQTKGRGKIELKCKKLSGSIYTMQKNHRFGYAFHTSE